MSGSTYFASVLYFVHVLNQNNVYLICLVIKNAFYMHFLDKIFAIIKYLLDYSFLHLRKRCEEKNII